MRTWFVCSVFLFLSITASAQALPGGDTGGGGNGSTGGPIFGGSSGPNGPPSGPINATVKWSGIVTAGQQPVVGASVYLFTASTAGYGTASVSLLNYVAGSTFADGSGNYYVKTDSNGNFGFPQNASYNCIQGTPLYAYASGGNAGAGMNSALSELAIMGLCPPHGTGGISLPLTLYINEVTTVAAAYAIAGFAVDATHVASSGSPLAQVGISNAFLNALNMASTMAGGMPSTPAGVALSHTPSGNGTVPQSLLNTLANVLASCTSPYGLGASACTTLFSYATSDGTSNGAAPSDIATAAINIAHHPGVNVSNLFALSNAGTQFPYSPALTTQPNDYSIGINFSGTGIADPYRIAIDPMGNAWILNPFDDPTGAGTYNGSLTELSSLGVVSPSTSQLNTPTLINPQWIAIDTVGNVWATSFSGANVTEFSGTGQQLSPSSGYGYGYLYGPYGIAIDGYNQVWVADYGYENLVKISNGITSPGYTGGGLSTPYLVAVDGAENIWVVNSDQGITSTVAEFTNQAQPLSGSGYILYPGSDAVGTMAMDSFGNAWITAYPCPSGIGCVAKLSPTGSLLSGTNGYTGGGIDAAEGIAIDGGDNVWISNNFGLGITELSNSGTALSPQLGYMGGMVSYPSSIAIDGSGDAWMTIFSSSNPSVTEIIGIATPVVTPLASGVANGALGSRP